MIKDLCKEYDIFMFDLDRTTFDTYTKKGEPIWAKQLIKPLNRFDEDLIVDDLEITSKVITKELTVKEKINMDSVANYLVGEGFKYTISADGKSEFWVKK